MRPSPLTLTPAAVTRLHGLLQQQPHQSLRLDVRPRGCSGLSYDISYVEAPSKGDLVIEEQGVRFFLAQRAEFFLLGSQMDYEISAFKEGFTFKNPNETGRCGCGESFTTRADFVS